MNALSETLKDLRNLRGLTQAEFSEIIGIQRATYAMYETGKNKPRSETLQKIADYYNVTTDYLLGVGLDKTDIIINKIITLTRLGKIPWIALNTAAFDFSDNKDIILKIMNWFENKIGCKEFDDYENIYVHNEKELYYIVLKTFTNSSYIIVAQHSLEKFPPINGFAYSNQEKVGIDPLISEIASFLEQPDDETLDLFLENLNKLTP